MCPCWSTQTEGKWKSNIRLYIWFFSQNHPFLFNVCWTSRSCDLFPTAMLWGPIKTALSAVFIGLQTLYTVFFPPSIFILGGKVQGFLRQNRKNLALEQRITVLKALDFKDICVVQYTLFYKTTDRFPHIAVSWESVWFSCTIQKGCMLWDI